MKVLGVVIALLVAAEAASLYDVLFEEWSLFKLIYNKSYTNNTEENSRLKVFLENKHKIIKHNSRYAKGLVSYNMKMNQFGDMAHHEFVSAMNGFKKSKQLKPKGKSVGLKLPSYIEPANVHLADTVDWREQGAVTPIKNQGQCGSCWSFSTTGSLEGQHFRKSGQLVSLSEQNLIDCSDTYGNGGCNGGLMDNAFQYITDNGGIDTESSYPYEGVENNCRYDPNQSGSTASGFVDLPQGDEGELMSAVATIGPISVAIDASHNSFQFPGQGVYYEPECSDSDLDHAVLVVGYGTEDGTDYWLVKNSWGTSWGDQGYIKMARNKDNNCGIATTASYPQV